MKLIKQTTLHFQDDRSDKIYEADLCQVGPDLYVVNFRYGRRGSTLKEGTKTDVAVPLPQAEKIFDKLVGEKVKKGYYEISSPNLTSIPQASPAIEIAVDDPHRQAVISCLVGRSNSKWPLERAIWRVGELKIVEAVPLLIQRIGTGKPLRDYCIAWSLGWCGGEEAVTALTHLYRNSSLPDFVRRISWEALRKLADAEMRSQLQAEKIEQLPPELGECAKTASSDAFSIALQGYLNNSNPSDFLILDTLYQIDNEIVRPALLATLAIAPFRPNSFKAIRHIFKIAEYRQDAEVLAAIAYRLEQESAMYRSQYGGVYVPGGGYINNYEYKWNSKTDRYEAIATKQFQREMQSPTARLAYSSKTREYLRKRVWRTLKQLGEDGDPNYVKLATAILLFYSDANAREVRQSSLMIWSADYRTYNTHLTTWDTFAGYLTFNHILYENSPRYLLKPSTKAWRCRETYKPGDPEPEVREEAFPQLWEQQPEYLLNLLLESQCSPVHYFAVKALKSCQVFCRSIKIELVIQLVRSSYKATAKLGFEIARERYNSADLNRELILATANCIVAEARQQAYQWVDENREALVEDSEFIAALMTSVHEDTRQFSQRFLSTIIISDRTTRILIGRIIAQLLTFEATPDSNTPSVLAKEISETLLVAFGPQLRQLGLWVVLDLLHHPLPEVQELGARILLNHETPAADLPPNLIESLLDSPYEAVRVIGVRLFGQLPDLTLIGEQRLLVVAMAIHSSAELRNAIKPTIRRLAVEYPAFASQLVTEFIDILMMPEKSEGIHSYLGKLLREDIPDWMPNTTQDIALQLLRSQSGSAQELGGFLLIENQRVWASSFETVELVKLTNHEILSVREAGRQIFLQNLDRIRRDSQEMIAAIRILESKWEDSREFAWRIFKTEFSSEEWTPEVMVSLCDNVQDDVRQFGRELVTRTFQGAYGQDYLLKFSEHPSGDMQLFASHYLESYAGDDPEKLRNLVPYFLSVLSRVNQGRVTKQRVFAFLDREALKSEAAARVVAEILSRQSVSMAIADRSPILQTMRKIQKTYPQLDLPIQVKPVSEVRR